ncbi:MAG TPA: hypothetical protein VF120_02700 [Ktedonobacterales bacterium]
METSTIASRQAAAVVDDEHHVNEQMEESRALIEQLQRQRSDDQQRIEQQQAEITALRTDMAGVRASGVMEPSASMASTLPARVQRRGTSRRRLLTGAGAAAAAATVALVVGEGQGAHAASASDGGSLTIGQANTGTSQTSLAVTGISTASPFFQVDASATHNLVGCIAIEGICNQTGGFGVHGHSSDTNGTGVYGTSHGSSGVAVFGLADVSGGVGVYGLNNSGGSGSGVHGVSTGGGSGVYGTNNAPSGGYGVYGESTNGALSPGTGVYGTSAHGTGVSGTSTNGSGVAGTTSSASSYGVSGINTSSSSGATGVYGSTSAATGSGVYGTSTSGNGYGVYGSGVGSDDIGVHGKSGGAGAGVYGTSAFGPAVEGNSPSGLDVVASGSGRIQQHLQASAGAPTSGGHSAGEQIRDSNGELWLCTVSGSPGTWVRVAHLVTGLIGGATSYLTKPTRLLDTRGDSPSAVQNGGGPISSAAPYTLVVAGVTNSHDGVAIPSAAAGAIGKVTVISGAGGSGFVALVPSGSGTPTTGTLPYSANQTIATSFNVGLGGSPGALDIYVGGSSVDVVIDIFAVVA